MNSPAAIQAKQNEMSVKEIALYTAGSIILIGGSLLLVRHIVRNVRENKEQNKSFDEGTTATSAKQLKMAFDNDGWPGTNTPEVRRILLSVLSKDELVKIDKSYKKLYNRNLYKDLEEEMQSSEYNEMLNIIAAKPQKSAGGNKSKSVYNYLAWAKRLKAAFDKTYGFLPGTDEQAIKVAFSEIPTQAAFMEVAKAYQNEYQTSLIEDLKSELELWEYTDYMKIITSKPKS